jgi:CRISPR type I-E-associated protein CasB/Cse2
MTDPRNASDHSSALIEALREVRRKYDALDRGASAPLRRCRSADEVALEGAFWRIGGDIARQQRGVANVVLLFPAAPHATMPRFSFGHYLHTQIGERSSGALRFRRLLDSRDRGELDHRLRGVVKLAASDRAPVDWGVLGRDILWFFAESDRVRRQWAQDFYAPRSDSRSSITSTDSAPTPDNG